MPPSSQPSKTRTPSWAVLATALLLLVSSGCVVASEESPGGSGEEPAEAGGDSAAPPDAGNGQPEVIASSVTTATDVGADLQIDVNALERLDNDLLRLRMSITNNSPEGFDIGFGLAEDLDRRTGSKVSLLDDANQQRYLSHDKGDGSCFCEILSGPIESGATETLWVMFPGDKGELESMTVTTPLTPPFLDIPITDVSESVEQGHLGEPRILDLTLISDSLDEDQTGRTESGDEVSIILSSDVLFGTGSSDLSDEAQEILAQVAQEINDASSTEVSVDGYADNTGDDSVNLPLSRERAESVESALSDLITRQGVTFAVEGHGSADPIADNTTDAGRERNRRVSVTFEK